jgi:transposase
MLPEVGRLIYSEYDRSKNVKISDYVVRTQQIIDEISLLYVNQEPPKLVLNKHCAVCDFQSRCRGIAAEHDDLSQLTAISPKELTRYNEKGIFTIKQLSYGYRPRRRRRVKPDAKHDRHPARHDHKLKALAIKKAQIHVVGAPALNIRGTPAFLDVEGMPDRDFYYLIGLRFGRAGNCVEHSFWADRPDNERDIWGECLRTLKAIEGPQIVHYGAYESRFLRKMKERYQQADDDREFIDRLIATSVNLVSCVFGKIYFPTHSNSLKEIGRHLGFSWTWPQASGAAAVLLRKTWETGGGDEETKRLLITYNIQDCRAIEVVAAALTRICEGSVIDAPLGLEVVDVSSLEIGFQGIYGKFTSVLPEFERINSAAYWDYQRAKVYVRSREFRRSIKKDRRNNISSAVEQEVYFDRKPDSCARCASKNLTLTISRSHVVFDLRFMRQGIKRWAIRYHYGNYKCSRCCHLMTNHRRNWQYGANLCAYVVYLLIEMRLSYQKTSDHITRLFNLPIRINTPSYIKYLMAKKYGPTYDQILAQIVQGSLIHADETKGVVRGGGHYVWVFANLNSVAYVYAETREAVILEEMLKGFIGVLVSDFYAAYDSVPCAQQKCLIHLMRDINEDVRTNPFNEELAAIARGFGSLLREIVETIDSYGLKARHLGKHKRSAARFLENVSSLKCKTEAGSALKKRIEKNKNRLFTFLDYDNVPWNNNNAEHAVHAFVKLRNGMKVSTPKGMNEYSILLSIQQTLQYRGKDFLTFLRSSQLDING